MIPPDTDKEFSVLIGCKSGYFIAGESDDPNVGIFAKATPADSFTDIIATPLDTTAFAPDRKQFYFKIEIDPDADLKTELIRIHVRPE